MQKLDDLKLFFAKQYLKILPNISYIGVTGDFYESTTAMACQKVIGLKIIEPVVLQIGKNNNLASSLFKISSKSKKVIVELNLEKTNEIEKIINLFKFSILVVNGVTNDSNDLTSSDGQKLIKILGNKNNETTLIVNWDNLALRKYIEDKNIKASYFGLDPKFCHVWASNIKIENFQTVFELNYGVERVEVKSLFLGGFQLYPLLAAAAVGIELGLNLSAIKKALELISPLDQHYKVMAGFNDSVVIDDTYHNFSRYFDQALDTLNVLPARRRILILGDTETESQKKDFKKIAQKIFKDRLDLVFLSGPIAKPISDELLSLGFLEDRLFIDLQNPQITSNLLKSLLKGDIVLVKGSKLGTMKDIVKKLAKTDK